LQYAEQVELHDEPVQPEDELAALPLQELLQSVHPDAKALSSS
jgi:hypothetical protein